MNVTDTKKLQKSRFRLLADGFLVVSRKDKQREGVREGEREGKRRERELCDFFAARPLASTGRRLQPDGHEREA